MKKTISIGLLLLFVFSTFYVDAKPTGIRFRIHRHRDCHGIGACDMETIPLTEPPKDDFVIATADIDENGHFFISIETADGGGMTSDIYREYFSGSYYPISEDFPINSYVLSEIGYAGDYIVNSGYYPITVSGTVVTVTF